jgi:sugar O-acyltransferase (sialic acid O-acetyltransferase NeuD family)
MKQIIIIGKGGHAKVVANIIKESCDDLVGYYDDGETDDVIGTISELKKIEPNEFMICAIGSNKARETVVNKINNTTGTNSWTNLIHPCTSVATDCIMGIGNIICPNATIQPSVIIGNHTIINTKASVDHDCKIGSFVHIAPGATLCGTVIVGDGAFIGANATIINNITVGPWSIIGAGSVVLKDVPTGYTVYGNPALLRKNTKGEKID